VPGESSIHVQKALDLAWHIKEYLLARHLKPKNQPGLENWNTHKGIKGSNPSLSASNSEKNQELTGQVYIRPIFCPALLRLVALSGSIAIRRFESSRPSHPVWSLWLSFPICEKLWHFRRLGV
jgi:hypothetical protein